MPCLNLYTLFHLNIAYSSIEEEQRPEVVRRCYWPILQLAKRHKIPLAIEASGYTLETIQAIDPAWIEELKLLAGQGLCEFIGSGYAQLIGPLVPAEVNAANLRLGNQTYRELLGLRPEVALVNEQAYASDLLRHYLDAGYKAVIMEWDNPARYHPEWDPAWRYLPQFARGPRGEEIPLIWNKSVAFQKFQRYAHDEMELDEYLAYLGEHVAPALRVFPLYANDAEVFDFRPGRYHTEAPLGKESEWARIERLFESLLKDKRFDLIRPAQALELLKAPGAGQKLQLESAEQPIPVKKQGKYNITRWAVTGPDDLGSNTACWRAYRALAAKPAASDADWRELCYLWSSDFRTHITESRWRRYCERLAAFGEKIGAVTQSLNEKTSKNTGSTRSTWRREGRFLVVETPAARIRLNCQKGLALDGLWPSAQDGPPLCGTLPHGFYDDIALSADWYTGHAVLEIPGKPKVTDLSPVEPSVNLENSGDVTVQGIIPTILGPVTKIICISSSDPLAAFSYRFDWKEIPSSSLRLGNITIHPEAFDRKTIWYRSENGGRFPQTLPLTGKTVDHGAVVSSQVSAQHGIGMTGGFVEIGDARRSLRVEVDQAASALIGLLTYQEVGRTYFCRLALSARETDETRRFAGVGHEPIECRVTLRCSPAAEIPEAERSISQRLCGRQPRVD